MNSNIGDTHASINDRFRDWVRAVRRGMAETRTSMREQRTATEAFRVAWETRPQETFLSYVHYDDQLSPDQIQLLLARERDSLQSQIDEAWWHSRHEQAMEEASALVGGEDVLRMMCQHRPELVRTLVDHLLEVDQADVLEDLLNRTGRALVRYRFGGWTDDGEGALEPDSWRWTPDRVEQAARSLADLAGTDFAQHRAAFHQLVEEATYGGELYVIWYAEVAELVEAVERESPVLLRWEQPHLLVLNRWNGSGHDVRLAGSLEAILEPDRLTLDSRGGGYSWDQVAGVHAPAYACTWTAQSVTHGFGDVASGAELSM